MTNEEIEERLHALKDVIPEYARVLHAKRPHDGVQNELELANMSLMAIWTMLGEIAKRLTPAKEQSYE